MAFTSLPPGGLASMDAHQWQIMAAAMAPDRVVSGLKVTALTGSTVRLGAGSATCGGCLFANSANSDLSSTANATVYDRYDRLVLQLTIGTGINPPVTLVPVIKEGTPGPTPQLPTLTQTAGGPWEMSLGYWLVPHNSSGTIGQVVNDGPGPGSVVYSRAGVSVPTNTNSTLGAMTVVPAGSDGPPPVTIGGEILFVAQSGRYTIDFYASMPNADSLANIFLNLPWSVPRIYFIQNLAQISATGYLPAGYQLTPSIVQYSGVTRTADVTVVVTRHP